MKRRFWGSWPDDLPEETWYDVQDRLEGDGRGTIGPIGPELLQRLERALEERDRLDAERKRREAEQGQANPAEAASDPDF